MTPQRTNASRPPGTELPRYGSVRQMLGALRPSYPVYCLWPSPLEKAARWFVEHFPGQVLYAVKCNPHPFVLDTIRAAGIRRFDTASLPEIALVNERYSDVVCYFHHPVKPRAAIHSARHVHGIRHYTIDSLAELDKITSETGGGDLAVQVRVATPPTRAAIDLSRKFGAAPEQVPELLRAVVAAGYEPGISFHVGSQCLEPDAFRAALALTGEVLGEARVEIGALNVGGGFPAAYPDAGAAPLGAYQRAIAAGLDGLGLPAGCAVLCEPGRAMVAEAGSVVAQVLLRKDRALYLNDGIFGCLSDLRTDIKVRVMCHRLVGDMGDELAPFTLFGPTCDSADVLAHTWELPAATAEGDWVEFQQMGAYSNSLATRFNGFSQDAFVIIDPG